MKPCLQILVCQPAPLSLGSHYDIRCWNNGDDLAFIPRPGWTPTPRIAKSGRFHFYQDPSLATADMRYVMKQKLFSVGDKYRIQNEAGQDVFLVNGRALSFGDKLSFQDMAGGGLAFYTQKML